MLICSTMPLQNNGPNGRWSYERLRVVLWWMALLASMIGLLGLHTWLQGRG